MTEKQKQLLVFMFISGWILYFALFWSKALFFDPAGNLVAGHVNIWGDWAAHMTMGTAMAERGPLLTVSPLLIGQPFAYPFVSNMISGILLKLGAPLVHSFVIPSFIFSILMILALLWFYTTVFKSRAVALIASLVFLCNGGVGFYYFGQDILNSPAPLQTLLNPPHEYTRYDDKHLKWISVIDSMIIPQRAFALGFPLAVIALGLVYQSTLQTQTKKKVTTHTWTQLSLAATLVGVLPIIHTHSFLALFIIIGFWASSDVLLSLWQGQPWKVVQGKVLRWLGLAGMTSIIAIPLIMIFFSSNVGEGFTKWYPGWLATDYKESWWIFWFKNWSITPLVAAISWVVLWIRTPKSKLIWPLVFLPFFVLFIAANLWLFQPFAWDNTKIFVWASLGYSGLVGLLLHKSWLYLGRTNLTWPVRKITRLCLILLFLSMTLSGMIDAYYISRHDLHSHILFSAEEVGLADWVKKNTDKKSHWLTGEPHNHWLFVLTGRQALMTYRGWMWTHGYNYQPVESDISMMFSRPKANLDLFKKYDVSYAVVGYNEREVWKANETEFKALFPIVYQTKSYTIFEIPN